MQRPTRDTGAPLSTSVSWLSARYEGGRDTFSLARNWCVRDYTWGNPSPPHASRNLAHGRRSPRMTRRCRAWSRLRWRHTVRHRAHPGQPGGWMASGQPPDRARRGWPL